MMIKIVFENTLILLVFACLPNRDLQPAKAGSE